MLQLMQNQPVTWLEVEEHLQPGKSILLPERYPLKVSGHQICSAKFFNHTLCFLLQAANSYQTFSSMSLLSSWLNRCRQRVPRLPSTSPLPVWRLQQLTPPPPPPLLLPLLRGQLKHSKCSRLCCRRNWCRKSMEFSSLTWQVSLLHSVT